MRTVVALFAFASAFTSAPPRPTDASPQLAAVDRPADRPVDRAAADGPTDRAADKPKAARSAERIVNRVRPSPAHFAVPAAADIDVDSSERPPDDVQRGLESVSASLDQCSTGLVATDPGLPVAVVIDAAGTVRRVAIEGAPMDARAQCVVRAISAATFTPSQREFDVARFRLVPEAVPEGGIAVVGPLAKERILAVFEKSDTRSCYRQSQAQQDEIVGAVAVRFVVNERGKPVDVAVDHMDPGLGDVAQCLVAHVQQLEFPASNGRTVVTYPFEL